MPHVNSDYQVEGGPNGEAPRLAMLDQLDRDLFRNRFSEFERNDHLFGGQVLMQSLAAAAATVENRTCHSLHGYFLRAGSASQRVIFKVERTRDGGRFSTRRVVAEQNSCPIFHMECSFHTGERGFEHQSAYPLDVLQPDALLDMQALADAIDGRAAPDLIRHLRLFRLIEMRVVDPDQLLRPQQPARRQLWLRIPSAEGIDDPLVHQQLIAYMSDYWLAGAALVPHPIRSGGPDLFMASLDHALWFHRPHRAHDWLLYDCDSPFAGDGRGLARGLLYDQHGALVASVAQEALMRPR